MRTTDLFNFNRSSKRLNESLHKTFGTRINFEDFDTPKLEDARNKLRTQIHTARTSSGFNETVENEALTKAQFMHDAIVAELADREEHIVDTTAMEGSGIDVQSVNKIISRFDQNMNEIGGYGDPDYKAAIAALEQGDVETAIGAVVDTYGDQDGGEVRGMDAYIQDLQDEFEYIVQGDDGDEGGDTDDAYALASAGHGSDEDYGDFPESMEERVRDPEDWDEGNTEPPNNFAVYINGKKWKVFRGRGQYADDAREKAHYQQLRDWAAKKSAATGKKWEVSVTGENPTESISAEGSHQANTTMKHVKNPTAGEKQAAKDIKPGVAGYKDRVDMLKSAEKDGRLKGESAPPTAKGERMVKHIKAGYANDGKLTDKEKGIAYATAWKQHNKESVETGDDMTRLQEGEIQQASAIVTAKTMVDRVGRWIEELSGMENDTLLQLGDSIRDEMGQEQAKAFIEAVAPAIQQALETLKGTRDTLSTGVRSLASGEQPTDMLGAEPGADMAAPAEPDAMNAEEPIPGVEDEFAAAEPAAGGMETAGREQRESIDRQSRLMKILAG
jgi:hypothetical protein